MRMSKKQYYVMCDMDAFAEYPISVRAPRRYDKYMVNRRVVAKLDQDNCALYGAHYAIGELFVACKTVSFPEIEEMLDGLFRQLGHLHHAYGDMANGHGNSVLQDNSNDLTDVCHDIRRELGGDGDIDIINDLIYKLHEGVDNFLDGVVLEKQND